MKNEIIELLNKQVIDKLEEAYLYLEFSNFFNSNGQSKYETYYSEKAKEEINKAMYINDYLNKKDADKKMILMHKPAIDYKSVEEVFSINLNRKNNLSKLITKLRKISLDLGDTSLTQLLENFMNKQTKDNAELHKSINLSKMYAS